MLQMVQTSNPDRAVPTRRISFEESLADLPKHFAGDGNVLASHIIAVLSSLFPDGEDFFVRSVRNYRDQITDPVLKRQVAGFIGQESVHGREHRVLNDRLAELGYSTQFGEKVTFALMKFVDATAPKIGRLAVTAAVEHFTATLGELVLRDEELRDTIGTTGVREVFEWHALEETEHKAVAFDVFRAVGGSEFRRRLGMRIVRPGFVVLVTLLVGLSLLRDPAIWRPKNLKAAWGLRHTSLFSKQTWRTLNAYDKRGFHPDDFDTDELCETWRAELFGREGYLNDKLAGAGAAAA